MRLLRLHDFLNMPEGTVYALYGHGQMGGLCIKGETTEGMNQFLYSEISVAIRRQRSDNPIASLQKAVETGEPIELDFETMNCERDIMPNQLFMAWSKQDVGNLVKRLVGTLVDDLTKPTMPFYPAVRICAVGDGTMSGLLPQDILAAITETEHQSPPLKGIITDPQRDLAQNNSEISHQASNFRVVGKYLLCDIQVLDNVHGQRLAAAKHVTFHMRGWCVGPMTEETYNLVGVDALVHDVAPMLKDQEWPQVGPYQGTAARLLFEMLSLWIPRGTTNNIDHRAIMLANAAVPRDADAYLQWRAAEGLGTLADAPRWNLQIFHEVRRYLTTADQRRLALLFQLQPPAQESHVA